MASTARWGLKPVFAYCTAAQALDVGMASTARWGLKQPYCKACSKQQQGRNGLYSPLGIETHSP